MLLCAPKIYHENEAKACFEKSEMRNYSQIEQYKQVPQKVSTTPIFSFLFLCVNDRPPNLKDSSKIFSAISVL